MGMNHFFSGIQALRARLVSLVMTLLAIIVALATVVPALPLTSWAATQSPDNAGVLVVYSFNEKMPWQRQFRTGLEAGLKDAEFPLTLYEENIDAGRFPGLDHLETFRKYLEEKYADTRLDMVVSESGPASVLVTRLSDSFHGVWVLSVTPDADIVVTLNQTPENSMIQAEEDIIVSFDEALAVTQARRVFVVGETSTPLVNGYVKMLRENRPAGFKGLDVQYLLDLPMSDLLNKVRELPQDSVIFYVLIFRDGAGQSYTPYQAAQQIAAKASVPAFSHWDSLMGSGIVGGYVVSGHKVGQIAAKDILTLLSGYPPETHQGTSNQVFDHMYDWRAATRFGIDEEQLPEGSRILYRQPSFWSLYKSYIIAAGAIIVFLCLMVAMLMYSLIQRRQAQKALEEERARLEDRVAARTEDLSLSNQRLAHLNKEFSTKNQNLENALAEIRTLRGFLPICVNCKKIRDDQGYWNQVEKYVQARSEAVFSHSICPDCMKKLYPDVAESVLEKVEIK